MTTTQKVIKYLALAFAIFLAVSIIGGILGAVGVLGIFFGDEVVTEDLKTYSVSGEIRHLELEIYAANLHIKEGSAFSVESNLKNLKVTDKNGYLMVKDTTKNGHFGSEAFENAVLTICVPKGTVFDHVDLSTGAGKVTMDTLSAKTLDFELGAGEVTISSLTATDSADIEGGAGRITISQGALKNLELEMGVGQLNLTSQLTGDCRFDMGVGESNLTVLGKKEDYKLDLSKGIGGISVDGTAVSDYGSSGSGANKLEINGGVGAINIAFQAPEVGATTSRPRADSIRPYIRKM